jgi:hypothetical protein
MKRCDFTQDYSIYTNTKKKWGLRKIFQLLLLITYGLLNDAVSAAGSAAVDVETPVNNKLCLCHTMQ